MPNMADITVLNAAAGNAIYVAKNPSSGDKTWARWTQDAAHAIAGFRPVLQVMTRDNASGKPGRVLSISHKEPIIGAVNGVDTQLALVPFTLETTIPTNVDAAKVYDAYVKATNLAVSTLLRAVAAAGYAPQ